MTMKAMLRAAIVVFSIGTSSAHAGDGDGYSPTTLFTSIPGQQSPRGGHTTNRPGNWLFQPASNSGER
jgi:hypothetical protein